MNTSYFFTELFVAATEGDHTRVAELIPVCPPICYGAALRQACWNDHEQCVRLLLTVADPLWNNSQVLRSAVECDQVAMIDLLCDVCDVDVVLEDLEREYLSHLADRLRCIVSARHEKQALQAVVGSNNAKTSRKI